VGEGDLVRDADRADDVAGDELRLLALVLPLRAARRCDEAVVDADVDGPRNTLPSMSAWRMSPRRSASSRR
jgi:hypothetical protein